MLRILLALVLALAAPAMPAGAHESGMPMALPGHAMNGMKHDGPMPSEHVCVGCIAVADLQAERIAPPPARRTPVPIVRIAALPLLPGEAPTPPPPRIA